MPVCPAVWPPGGPVPHAPPCVRTKVCDPSTARAAQKTRLGMEKPCVTQAVWQTELRKRKAAQIWKAHFQSVSARGSAWLCWGRAAEGQLAGEGEQRRVHTERRPSRYLDRLDILLHLRLQLLLQLGCEKTERNSDARVSHLRSLTAQERKGPGSLQPRPETSRHQWDHRAVCEGAGVTTSAVRKRGAWPPASWLGLAGAPQRV